MNQAPAGTSVALRCTLEYPDVDTFVAGYSRNLSSRGIFLPAAEPPPLGTVVTFEVVLASGWLVLRGEGTVLWQSALDPTQPDRLHGMALRFTRLDAQSRVLIERVAAHKTAHPASAYATVSDFFDVLPNQPAAAASAVSIPAPAPSSRSQLPPAAEDAELLALQSGTQQSSQLDPQETARKLEALLSSRRGA